MRISPRRLISKSVFWGGLIMTKTISRLDYIDKTKALACVLVVLGHFIMSMDASNILPYNSFTEWFKENIYTFHVQLFFLCSGLLYVFSIKQGNHYKYGPFVFKKLIALGIPYLTFTTITVLMKMLAGDSVNTETGGLLYTLFIEPTAPYWYLYVLFFLFLIIPPFQSKKAVSIVLGVSLILKIIMITGLLSEMELPYFVTGIMNYSIWFVLGMTLVTFEYKADKKFLICGAAGLIVFLALSAVWYHFSLTDNKAFAFILGVIAVLSIFTLFSNSNIKTDIVTKFLIKYNLPIYLMHTIFAAGVRIVLVKLGITAWYIHIPAGLIATFIGPAIAAFIMEKTRFLEIFLYPTKLIKISRSK